MPPPPAGDSAKQKIPEAEASGNLLEVTTRFELVDEGFADPCLTTWPRHHIRSNCCCSIWSGRRGSNSLPPPWQGGALPDELNPHGRICASGKPMRSCHCCGKTLTYSWCLRSESNQRHGDFQSPALPTELQRQATWMRLELTTSAVTGRRSNQLNYQAKVVGAIGLEPMTLCL